VDIDSLGMSPPRIPADYFQPSLLPIKQAPGLATAMSISITAGFEMDCPIETARPERADAIVAGLVSLFVDFEFPPAKGEHLWHKWHPFEPPVAVEGLEDFFLAKDFHPLADFQPKAPW
jgi:hypothetical protein